MVATTRLGSCCATASGPLVLSCPGEADPEGFWLAWAEAGGCDFWLPGAEEDVCDHTNVVQERKRRRLLFIQDVAVTPSLYHANQLVLVCRISISRQAEALFKVERKPS
jgi:hypothetical protein